MKPGGLDLLISNLKQRFDDPADAGQAALLRAYQEGLAGLGCLDLDDLVRQAVWHLHQDPGLYKAWQKCFKHICVDEYQDVNPVQVELLRVLVGPACQVSAIGDPDQAIYGFRGADSGLFSRFDADFIGAAQMGLSLNYRSRPPIVDLGQSLLDAQPDESRQVLSAYKNGGEPPIALEFPTPRAEAEWIASEIGGLLGGLDSRQVEDRAGDDGAGFAACDIAVLYRVHALAGPLKKALEQAGIPVQVAAEQHLGELDPLDLKAQRVSLLSMHAAKGLEWPVVFIAGLEAGVMPFEPPGREPAPLAEERRLLYVAITRAEQRLYLTRAKSRMLYGQWLEDGPSCLWGDLPIELMQWRKQKVKPRKARQLGLFKT
jgi:DNA helicase-2/ATP-dependent DNA helicase PcrA